MKRITIWIDVADEKIEATKSKMEDFLESLELVYKTVAIDELISVPFGSK